MLLDRIYRAIGAGTGVWLVGGAVRDIALGRPLRDIDIAVASKPDTAAKRLSETLDGTWFALDPERGVYRVVCRDPDIQVDVSEAPGGIHDDLTRRDFTVNAMALPLGEDTGASEAIDPFGGMRDVEGRTIRAPGRSSFTDDPLRTLRAFRLEAELGFGIEPLTLGWIRESAGLITGVSAERVRDELYLILETPGPSAAFRRMWEGGLLGAVIPEIADMKDIPQPPPHEHGLLEHSFRSMYHAEQITSGKDAGLGDLAPQLSVAIGEVVEAPLTMRGLTILCALLHDIGKPATMKDENGRPRFIGHDTVGAVMAAGLGTRLRTSVRVREILEKTARHHMRPLMLSRRDWTGRALYRMARDAEGAFLPLMLVALADALATRERPGTLESDVEGLVRDALSYYYCEYTAARADPLITGRDLIDKLGLQPGPLFGIILEEVEAARADGKLAGRQDALEHVRANLERYRSLFKG